MTRTDTRSIVSAQAARMAVHAGHVHPTRDLFLALLAIDPLLVSRAWQQRKLQLESLLAAIEEWWPEEKVSAGLSLFHGPLLAGLPEDQSLLPVLLDRLLPPTLTNTPAALVAVGLL